MSKFIRKVNAQKHSQLRGQPILERVDIRYQGITELNEKQPEREAALLTAVRDSAWPADGNNRLLDRTR